MCRFEKIKRLHVTLDLFTVEEGTMTPTLKLRRYVTVLCSCVFCPTLRPRGLQKRCPQQIQTRNRDLIFAWRTQCSFFTLSIPCRLIDTSSEYKYQYNHVLLHPLFWIYRFRTDYASLISEIVRHSSSPLSASHIHTSTWGTDGDCPSSLGLTVQ